MRRLLPLALLGLLTWVGPPASAANQSVLTTSDNKFVPADVTINVGDTVTWRNNGGLAHTVTSTTDGWAYDEGITAPGDTTSFKFTARGNYTYVCDTHKPGMTGVVRVVAASSPRPTTKSPTPTRTTRPPSPPASSPPPTASESPEPDETPTSRPSLATFSPPTAGPTRTAVPLPSLPETSETPEPEPSGSGDTISLGGLRPPPPTGRERGLPIALAVVTLGGVITAQFRALLHLER